jgi:hypothetical protein
MSVGIPFQEEIAGLKMVSNELLNELNRRFDFILNEKNSLFDACYLLATSLDPDLFFCSQ